MRGGGAHCSLLNVLFSTPAWLSRTRATTLTRSSGVRNQAVVGESGKKNQKSIEVNKVKIPVIVTNHCQGSKPGVRMWMQPKATMPKKMMPTPFMRTGNWRQNRFLGRTSKGGKHTPVSRPLDLFRAGIEHGGYLKQVILEVDNRYWGKLHIQS
jgi:hypothetical protein